MSRPDAPTRLQTDTSPLSHRFKKPAVLLLLFILLSLILLYREWSSEPDLTALSTQIDREIDNKIDSILINVIDRFGSAGEDVKTVQPGLQNYSAESISVLWYTSMKGRAEHDSGFVQESLNFMIPLYNTLDFGWYAGCTLLQLRQNKLFNEFSKRDQGILENVLMRGSQLDHELAYRDTVITIVFERPYVYKNVFESQRMKYSVYKIGRAMFETDWIPNDMEYPINEYLDELWVPSAFAKQVFQSAGIYIPITVIGEGFNPAAFSATPDPSNTTNRRKFYPKCNTNDVVFFSVGNMTKRKGILLLISTWLKWFTAKDPACLYIRADMKNEHRRLFKLNGLRIFEMPRLSNQDLVSCYQSADVFVLPTHGEGWGRPIMEAMAAGLPVIVPLWSGLTEFVKEEYALPVHVKSLEQAFVGQHWVLGGKKYQHLHHWARINTHELGSLLVWCTKHRDQLPIIGAKGRAAVFADYSWESISNVVRKRLQEVKEEISVRGIEHYREKNRKQMRAREREREKTHTSQSQREGKNTPQRGKQYIPANTRAGV